jgi:hypothetical protein
MPAKVILFQSSKSFIVWIKQTRQFWRQTKNQLAIVCRWRLRRFWNGNCMAPGKKDWRPGLRISQWTRSR